MKRLLSVMFAVALFMININIAVPVSAAVDNSKYIPKIVTENGKSNLVFDPEVAKIAKEMANDTYSMSKSKKASKTAKTLKNEDFTDIQQNFHEGNFLDNYLLADNFHVGVKTFEINGEKKHILAIAFRGSHDAGDWHVNIAGALSYDGFHIGFYTAADDAHKTLRNMKFESLNMTFNEYLNCAKITDDYYILVTGHSLGGAVANIYAGEYLASKCGIRDAVMCYTFAAPTVCTANKAKQRNATNIFNIINTEDTVPKIGYVWGDSARFGKDLKVKVTNSSEDAHDLKVTYEKAMIQVINNIGSMYKYTIPYYIKWKNGGTDDTPGSNGDGFRGENNTQEPVTPQGTTTDNSEQIERNKIIQTRLNSVMGAGLEVDGICGQQTIEAIKKFQRAYGLTVDGICGSATWNKLEEVYNNPQSVPENQDKANISVPTTLDAPKRVGIDYSNTKTTTIPININGTIPEGANLQGECNQSISATWEQVAGQNVVNAYVTANYKLKDIDGVLTAKIVDKTGNVLDSIQIVIYNTSSRFTIKFDANGGTNAPAEVIKCEGFYSEIPYLRPTREGYEFAGWSTSKYSDEVEYDCGDEIIENRDITLYAVWADEYAFSPLKLQFDKFISDTSEEKVIQYNFIMHDWVEKPTVLLKDVEIISDSNTHLDWWLEENEDGERCLNVAIERKGTQKKNDVTIKIISKNDECLFEENIIINWPDNDFPDRNRDGITVYVDGEKLEFDVQPRMINSRTMVPMRAIFEALGAKVEWNNAAQTAVGKTDSDLITITIGSNNFIRNGYLVDLDSPAIIISGRTLVPVRAIAESFGCKVVWHGEIQVVEILK